MLEWRRCKAVPLSRRHFKYLNGRRIPWGCCGYGQKQRTEDFTGLSRNGRFGFATRHGFFVLFGCNSHFGALCQGLPLKGTPDDGTSRPGDGNEAQHDCMIHEI